MSRYCPIMDQKVTYQFCEDCDEKICRNNSKQNKTDCNNNSNVIFDCGSKNDNGSCKWI